MRYASPAKAGIRSSAGAPLLDFCSTNVNVNRVTNNNIGGVNRFTNTSFNRNVVGGQGFGSRNPYMAYHQNWMRGNWNGAYGADGYNVSQDATTKTPSYAQVSFSNQADYTWASSTSDGRALAKPENLSDRVAGNVLIVRSGHGPDRLLWRTAPVAIVARRCGSASARGPCSSCPRQPRSS